MSDLVRRCGTCADWRPDTADVIATFEEAIVTRKVLSQATRELGVAQRAQSEAQARVAKANSVLESAKEANSRVWDKLAYLTARFGDSDVLTTLAAIGGDDK